MLVDDGLLKLEDDRWNVIAELSTLPVPPTIHVSWPLGSKTAGTRACDLVICGD